MVLTSAKAPLSLSASSGGERLPALDGLRGIAALLIVFGHWEGGVPAEAGTALYWVKRALFLHAGGVDLFFVLSGFLIGGILIDHRTSPNLLRVFWLRRAARILPLFFLFIATFEILLHWLGPPLVTPNDCPLWSHALFMSNFWMSSANNWDGSWLSISWSLAIEEQVYLTLPFVILFVSPTRRRSYLLAAIVSAPVLRELVWQFEHHLSGAQLSMAAHQLPFCRIDAFGLGVLLAHEHRQPRPFWSKLPKMAVWAAGLLPGAILVWLTVRRVWSGNHFFCAFGYSAFALFFGWCVVMALTCATLGHALGRGPLAWVGRHSYFIYLFHPLIWIVADWTLARFDLVRLEHPLLHLACSAATLVVLAIFSMRWFEAPILRLGRRQHYLSGSLHAVY